MSSMIQTNYDAGRWGFPTTAQVTKGTRTGSFLDIVSRVKSDAVGVSGPEARSESVDTEAYLKHLKNKYGRVTIESIGKDQASLEKAGKRMSGNDVIIAPNILEDMASDAKTAVYYEQKIDYFFNTVIPRESAFCAARGLVFEPGGVVVHEDGTVTYICGCSDSPERIAEVNRINREKAQKKAAQQKLYLEQSAAAAAHRRVLAELAAQKAALEKNHSSIGDLLTNRAASAAAIPEVPLPSGAALFFLGL